MFLHRKVSTFFILIGSLFSLSCSLFTSQGGSEPTISTWEYNTKLRKELKEKEVKYKDNQELLGESAYKSQDFKNIYSSANNKSIFDIPKDPINKFDFLEDLTKTEHNTTYEIDKLYEYAANFANAILKQDENILAWKVPSLSFKNGNTYDSEANKEKAIVYLQGGPTGDVSKGGLGSSAYVYGKYGTMYYLNQGQFGFIPEEYVHTNKEEYLKLAFSDNIKNKIQKNDLNELQEFQVLMKDTKEKLSGIQILLVSSMAFNKIEADKIALLGKKLKNEYHKIYFGGISHGFTIGVNAILENSWNLEEYDGIVVENNMLMPTLQQGDSVSGGIMYPDDKDKFVGNTNSFVNSLLMFSKTLVKNIYGQKASLEKMIKNPNNLKLLKKKVHFKIVLNDFNVGNPSEEELKFYYDNDLNFTIKYKGGHNALFTDEEYKKIFS